MLDSCHHCQTVTVTTFAILRTEAVYIADEQNQELLVPNVMVTKSIEQGVETEVFEAMPIEAREFLVKFHNGVDDRRDLMQQVRLVKKARLLHLRLSVACVNSFTFSHL